MRTAANYYIYYDLKCEVEDDGQICGEPVRNKKRMMCQKHYARWQRNGHVGISARGEAKARKEARRRTKERRMEEEGKSKVCICAHTLNRHSLNENCVAPGCLCGTFNGANELMFHQTMAKVQALNFDTILNNKAHCGECKEWIVVGKWHDPIALRRMKEHIRVKHIGFGFRRAG